MSVHVSPRCLRSGTSPPRSDVERRAASQSGGGGCAPLATATPAGRIPARRAAVVAPVELTAAPAAAAAIRRALGCRLPPPARLPAASAAASLSRQRGVTAAAPGRRVLGRSARSSPAPVATGVPVVARFDLRVDDARIRARDVERDAAVGAGRQAVAASASSTSSRRRSSSRSRCPGRRR